MSGTSRVSYPQTAGSQKQNYYAKISKSCSISR